VGSISVKFFLGNGGFSGPGFCIDAAFLKVFGKFLKKAMLRIWGISGLGKHPPKKGIANAG
jgi:hypothetical protein